MKPDKSHHILEEEILNLLRRRPCRITDIILSLGVMPAMVVNTLDSLQKANRVSKEQVGEEVFYKTVL